MKTNRIVVVGSSNTDMVVKSKTLPKAGQTVVGGSFFLAQGGKGANQAVAAARLGGEVVFVAKVGSDSFGEQALAGYEKEGIETSAILREPGQSTGVALILVEETGENLISVASGANACWNEADVHRIEPILQTAGILVLQLEIPLETVVRVAALSDRLGVPVLLDPAPAAELPETLFRHLSYIKPNEHEARQLTGLEITDEHSASRAAEVLFEKGVKNGIIITLGSRGAFAQRRGEEPRIVPVPSVQAADTTAAGDAFSGALASQLSRGVDLFEAVRYSNHVGALSATRLGAQPSLPTAGEVAEFMKKSPSG